MSILSSCRRLGRSAFASLLVAIPAVILLGSLGTASAQTVSDIRPVQGEQGGTLYLHGTGLDGLSTGDVTIGGTEIGSFLNIITSTLQPNFRAVEIPQSGEGPLPVAVAGQTAAKRFTIVTGGPATFPSKSVFYSDEDGTSSPQAVARGDINGDGHLDLVVGFAEAGSVVWFENNGAGSFGEGQTIAEDVNFPRDVVLADVVDDADPANAQDGALDVVVGLGQGTSGGSADDRVVLYANQRTGTDDVNFGSQTIFDSSPVDNVWGLAAGDIDADGDVDILSVSRDNGEFVRHENDDGASTFSTQQVLTFGDPRDVVIANLDSGDDILDAFVADYSDNSVQRLTGDGSGGFSVSATYQATQPVDLDVGDFDNDGFPGVAVATEGSGAEAVALVNASSTISRQQVSGTAGVIRTVHAADVDAGDGGPELVVGNQSAGEATLHAYSSGSFGSGATVAVTAGTPTDIATADVDADGDLDPVVLTQDQDQGLVIPNGSGAPQISSFPGDQTIQEDEQLGPLSFSIGDADDADSTLTVTGTSSDQSVVPDSNVTIGGSESERTLTATPLPDSNGTTTITVTVDDGTNTTNASFLLTVDAVNDPPVVTTNKPLLMGKQTTTTISDSVLRVTDVEDAPFAIDYTIDSPPANGTLLLNGEPTSGFTQADVNNGLVTYTHESMDGITDSFSFTVADQGGTGLSTTATFDITVKVIDLAAAQDTSYSGFVRVGQRDSVDVSIQNGGNVPLTDLQPEIVELQEIPPGATSAPDDFGPTPNSIDSLSPGETVRVPVGFRPSDSGARAAALRVVADTGAVRVPIVGRGVALSRQAGTATRGEAVTVGLSVEGGYRPNRDTLYVRRGGGTTYRAIPLQISSGSDNTVLLEAEIPASLVTTNGVDYYFGLGAAPEEDGTPTYSVTDPAGGIERAATRPNHLTVSFEQLASPHTSSPEAYRMVSIPAVPEGGVKAALRQTYGAYQPNRWRLERWDADEDSYDGFPEIDSLRPGQAFWLTTAGRETLRLSSGRTAEADRPVRLPLKAGWNQIGNPFGFSVPWDTVRAASELGPEQIDGPIAYRDSAYRSGQARLDPWRGYFVFSAESDTLVIPPVGEGSAGSDSSSKSDVLATSKADDSGYRLTVEALSSAGRSSTVLGLQAGAVVGRDQYDQAQAPPIGDGPLLGTLEPVGERKVAHTYSARPAAKGGTAEQAAGQTWTLRLQGPDTESEAQPVRLRLSGDGQMPEGWGRYLFDLKREKRIAAGASLELESGETRRVKVILGTNAYAETASEGISLSNLETGLRGSYPNPFEERATIEYVLSSEQDVTIEVYNVLGQRVRTLIDGPKKSGMHTVEWEGENQYGTPVGSGVYFYHLQTGETSETRKMVFVR